METMVLPAETLHLPERFASMLKGKKVELAKKRNFITITPVKEFDIMDMCGMFESDGHAVDRFLESCREDKEYELAIEERELKERAMRKRAKPNAN